MSADLYFKVVAKALWPICAIRSAIAAFAWSKSVACVLRKECQDTQPMPRLSAVGFRVRLFRLAIVCGRPVLLQNTGSSGPVNLLAALIGCSPPPGTRSQELSNCWYRDFSL